MTDELINKYYNETIERGHCWYDNSQGPLKDHCTGLQRPKCKEFATTEDHHLIIDTMIDWYNSVDEATFLESYNRIKEYHRS